jgi:SmpA / OmlA family
MSNDGMTKEIQMTKDRSTKGPSPSVWLFVFRYSFDIRNSSFVIFAATRLLLVLLIALCVSCSGKRITKANVDQITEGMSKKQVESVLGTPTSINNEDFVIMKKTTYVYRQGNDTVTIVFKDDKVQAKDSTLAR